MKKLISIMLFAALLIGACTNVEENVENENWDSAVFSVADSEEDQRESFDYEVRLTDKGFDATEINIKEGESLTIFVVDDDVDGHYLSIEGSRISKKELHKGDEWNVPLDEGSLEIIDEITKSSLKINVE
jgi:hypothetical protein